MWTTTERPWELQLSQRVISVSVCHWSWPWRLCRSVHVLVQASCALMLGRWCQHTGCSRGQWSRVEVWDCAALQQLEKTPGGELRKRPQTSPQRTQRDTQIGDDPACSMLLVDVLWCCSLVLCATLLCVVTKIVLCLYDCARVCVYVALRTGSSGDALTPPTLDITMESPSNWATVHPFCPPRHTWKTTIELEGYGCTGQLVGTFTDTGSVKAESGHISLCMCVSVSVWGQWRDDGKAKWCTHTHMRLSWHVWG